MRFHLDRRTGGVARDVERGMTSVSDLLDWTIYTILPTLFEIALICGILIVRYDWGFAAITLATLAVYITYTFSMTEWRLRFYRAANEADTEANARNVDCAAQLRDGQVFRQREARADPFRLEPGAARRGDGEKPEVARAAQRRPDRHRRGRADRCCCGAHRAASWPAA